MSGIIMGSIALTQEELWILPKTSQKKDAPLPQSDAEQLKEFLRIALNNLEVQDATASIIICSLIMSAT